MRQVGQQQCFDVGCGVCRLLATRLTSPIRIPRTALGPAAHCCWPHMLWDHFAPAGSVHMPWGRPAGPCALVPGACMVVSHAMPCAVCVCPAGFIRLPDTVSSLDIVIDIPP